MTLKTCTCGKLQTTKNSKLKGREFVGSIDCLWFNCLSCNTTFIVNSQVLARKKSLPSAS